LTGNHIATGKNAEDIALEFLLNKGLSLRERNYNCTLGEIDLIMQEGDITVFVEVRARTNNNVLHAIETIDRRKVAHIIRASEHYLQKNSMTYSCTCRFDLILFDNKPCMEDLHWLQNAFEN
jgi:putative endonuclease